MLNTNGTAPISVIVPSWNYGMFLRECLDSLIAQTVRPERIIIANDASTDDTQAIAIEYAKRHPSVLPIQNTERRGTIINENEATKHVSSPWLFFLDADDKVEPTYIEEAVNVIAAHDDKLAIVYSDMRKFGLWDGDWTVSDWDPVALRSGNYINGHSIFRTELYREVGGLKDNGNFEDHQLWVDMLDLNRGYYGVRIPKPLVWYRRHQYGHRTDNTDLTTRA